MSRIENLRAEFLCPKCRGKSAYVDHAAMPLAGGRFFPLKPARFIVVTCTLCGHTEFYDQSVWADETSTAEERAGKAISSVIPPRTAG